MDVALRLSPGSTPPIVLDGLASAEEAQDHLEHAPTPMSRVAPDGTILWANQAELDLLGYARDDYVGRNVAEFHLDPRSTPALLDAIRSGLGTRDQPVRLRARDGQGRHVLVAVNVRVVDGRIIHGRCTLRDITDRARVAEERQHVLEQAMASADPHSRTTDGYLHFDRDWRITFAQLNASPERAASIVGRTLWEVYPDVRGSEFEAHYRQAMAERKPCTFRAYYAPQGLWLENRLFPAGDGLALVYRDLTWQHDLEHQLKERSRQQAAVAALGHDALRGIPTSELLDRAVRMVADVLHVGLAGLLEVVPGGYRVGAAVGYPSAVLQRTIPPETVAHSTYALQQNRAIVVEDLATETRFTPSPTLLAQGAVSGVTVPLQGPDGPHGILGVHAQGPRRFSSDDVHFLESVASLLASALQRARVDDDLRRQRDTLEQTVAERTALLERSNHEMEAFNYTVSHDLRSPLRSIGGFAGLLAHRHGAALPPDALDLIGRIQQGVTHMGGLIDVLLDLARLHRVELQCSRVDLTALASAIGVELRQSSGRDVQLCVQPGLTALADPVLTRAVLGNLLGNAWKFTRGVDRPTVEVVAAAVPDGPGFLVRDNGVGFDMAHAGALFQPFHRLHSSGTFEGTGIGLATVRRIVERHGGRTWAAGEPGKGAEIGFTLPSPRMQ